jgi:hypothetical protein
VIDINTKRKTMKTTYTKLKLQDGVLVDLPADSTERHELVRVEHPLLASPLIVAAYATTERLPWKQALAAADKLTVYGLAMRAPTVEEAFMICDRSQYPSLPVQFFPDANDAYYTWTSTPDADPDDAPNEDGTSGYAWGVDLDDGYSLRNYVGSHLHVRAVRAGQ